MTSNKEAANQLFNALLRLSDGRGWRIYCCDDRLCASEAEAESTAMALVAIRGKPRHNSDDRCPFSAPRQNHLTVYPDDLEPVEEQATVEIA